LVEAKRAGEESPARSDKKQKSRATFTTTERQTLWRLILEFQAEALLPDRFIELSSARRLLLWLNEKCNGALPRRQVLGTDVLHEYAGLYAAEQQNSLATTQRISGGRVNFLSDGWQNISKQHILACLLSLFGVVFTYGIRSTGTEHHALVIAKQLEEILMEMQESGWNVGAIVTDNAGQCGRARRILARRWPKISFLRCFAHDINNLVKAVLKRVFKEVWEQAASVVNVLNASSDKWLVRANRAMIARYGKQPPSALCSLCVTRWNSMQKCFASLLRVRSALEDFHFTHRNDPDLPKKLHVLSEDKFWHDLKDAETVIRPLCFALHRLQRDENTLGDVVKSFGEIYLGFAASEHSQTLIPCVEERWTACEQPLFILGYFLHPSFVSEARRFPETRLTTEHDVCDFALYYYRRFISEDVTGLRGEMSAWIIGQYGNAHLSNFRGSLMKFWAYLQRQMPSDKLPALAVTVLSIAVNTETCERLFSELGLIHSPRRNQTRVDKTLKQQDVRQHVREVNRLENPKKVDRMSTERATAPLDPTELPCALVSDQCDSIQISERTWQPGPATDQHSTPRRRAGSQIVQTGVAAQVAVDIFTTPQRQVPASAERSGLRSSQRRSAAPTSASHNLRAAAAHDDQLWGSPASSVSTRSRQYCGAGNLSVLQDTPDNELARSVLALSRALQDDFATVQGDNEHGDSPDGETGGEVDGDEACISIWDDAILETSVANDAQPERVQASQETEPGFDTCLEIIPPPDRRELPTENVANFHQESTLRGIRARKVALKVLFSN
jgi:hypothetical protein